MRTLFVLLTAIIPSVIFPQFLEEKGSLTLAPFAPQEDIIFGVEFGSTPPDVIVEMQSQGLVLDKSTRGKYNQARQVFIGVPEILPTVGLYSYMDYFDHKLYRITCSFYPSYTNFLILKNALQNSLKERYTLSENSQERLDPMLKANLAVYSEKEISAATERIINESVLNGKSVLALFFEDKQKKIRVGLQYRPLPDQSETYLTLSYIWLEGEKNKNQEIEKASDQSGILPQ